MGGHQAPFDLSSFSPILGIGAGTGYWAHCLEQLGAEVRAFDCRAATRVRGQCPAELPPPVVFNGPVNIQCLHTADTSVGLPMCMRPTVQHHTHDAKFVILLQMGKLHEVQASHRWTNELLHHVFRNSGQRRLTLL